MFTLTLIFAGLPLTNGFHQIVDVPRFYLTEEFAYYDGRDQVYSYQFPIIQDFSLKNIGGFTVGEDGKLEQIWGQTLNSPYEFRVDLITGELEEYSRFAGDFVHHADLQIEYNIYPPGDSNLDGKFDSGDLIEVFSYGLYETGKYAKFLGGDWNVDYVFDSGDLITAFVAGTYSANVMAVPESSCIGLLFLLAVAMRRTKPEKSGVDDA